MPLQHKIWAPKPFIVAGGYLRDSALEAASKRENIAVAVGRYFISNPDLPERWIKDLPMRPYDRSVFYVPGEDKPEGYITYTSYEEEQRQKLEQQP